MPFILTLPVDHYFRSEYYPTMQILYCDECGTRVDETEAVELSGRTYCPQCARKYAPAPSQKSTGTTVLPPPSRSTRTQRPPKTTPARNLPSGAHTPVSANFGNASNVAHNRPDTEFQAGRNAPPKPTPLAAMYQWSSKNKPLAISIGLGSVAFVFLILWKLSSSSNSLNAIPTVPKNNTVIVPTPNPALTVSTAVVTTPATTTLVPVFKDTDPDPRTDKAMRDWKSIKELAESGKANPYDLRKRLDAFLMPFWVRKTDMGIEATKLLAKYKAEKRPADKSDGAVPGVTAAIAAEDAFNTDFKPQAVKTITEISFPNVGSLKANLGRDVNFTAKFTGFIEIPVEGKYTFFINSDDGSMLYIGDYNLVDNNGSHPMTERDGSIELKPGKHRFRLDYFNGASEGGIILSWSGPNIAKQTVPASALFTMPRK
jgi:hypothetical protein